MGLCGNEVLARAWISGSEDRIIGGNQGSMAFSSTLHRHFTERDPAPGSIPAGRYGHRTAASCKAHFDDISADAQKFCVALRKAGASSPTGVNEDNIFSMEVAIHLGEAATINQNREEFDKNQ